VETTTSTYESAARLTAADKSLILRVVGFLEYGMALKQLDEFVQRASPDELKAADELVGSREEFTVYTSLRGRLQRGPSTLAPVAASAADSGGKKGLAWVIGLARIEMGGILATFSSHRSPFEVVKPTKFDMAAYRELLLDGAQTHVWALVNDPEVAKVAKSTPDTKMLAYIRRLNMVRLFLHAGVMANANQITPPQAQEAIAQDSQISKLRDQFSASVLSYLTLMNSRQSAIKTNTTTRDVVNACGIQLRRESTALQTGKATSQTFPEQ
jgi:hypothetical protein